INGYDTVVLTVDGKQYVRYIHKLVAEELLHNDDPENKTEVIHIDGNKRNNAVSNLKWVKKGEGASRYFQTSDTRRNKFDNTQDLPGTVLENESIQQKTENTKSRESLSDRELAGKINRLSKEIETTKSRYNQKIMKLDMEFQKQTRQLKEHYKQDPAKAEKEEKELTKKHQANKEQLQSLMQKRIKALEAQKSKMYADYYYKYNWIEFDRLQDAA
ncbi:MAG: HNH endonuclease, partial [Bacteroidales bacterium]|nr:HNH endonuclease [Bacteroidales bacterium]